MTTLNLHRLFCLSVFPLVSSIVCLHYVFKPSTNHAKSIEDFQVNSSIFHALRVTSYKQNREEYYCDKKIHSYHWALALWDSGIAGYTRLVQGARASLLNVKAPVKVTTITDYRDELKTFKSQALHYFK